MAWREVTIAYEVEILNSPGPQVFPKTALYFVEIDGTRFAVVEQTPDDAISIVVGAILEGAASK